MNRSEIATLLARAAVYDQRTIGQADIEGWHDIAQAQGWTAAAAQRVVIEHYSASADRPRITPAAVTDAIREARRSAAATFAAPDPPDDLPAREYPAWLRARRDEHIRRVLDAWADGAPMPVTVADAAELTGAGRPQLEAGLNMTTCPPELRAQVARDFERIGRERPDRHRPAVALPRRMAGDPARRAAARAELADREPAPMPEPATEADGEATA
jgi:hypothetical protein